MEYTEPTFEIKEDEIRVEPTTNVLGTEVVFYVPISTFFYFLIFRRYEPNFFVDYLLATFTAIVLYYLIRLIITPKVFFQPIVRVEDIEYVEGIDSDLYKNSTKYWRNHLLSGFKPRRSCKIFLIHRKQKMPSIGFAPNNYCKTKNVLKANGIILLENLDES